MIRRRLLPTLALAALALTGCDQAQDKADDVAQAAASKAAAAAQDAASGAAGSAADQLRTQVKGQVCARIADGEVSAQDRQLLQGLLQAAEGAGLPAELTDPLRQVAESGDQVPAEALQRLQDGCA